MENEGSITLINEELNVVKNEEENIKNLIYTIRGKQVMLDNDVAKLYHYDTKNLNKAMKRNIERFPEDFCFKLTEQEVNFLRFQIGTSKNNIKLTNSSRGGRRYLPYAYTEQGISMLAGILKNDIAIKVSINIIRAFIETRRLIYSNGIIFERFTNIEHKLLEHDKKIDEVFNLLQQEENIKQKIFFEGQIYDAYSLIIDIIKRANRKITIIDNYVDDSILQMLTKKKENVEAVILTSEKSNITNLDIKKFNKEYPILKVAKTNKFHDRFIIIDNKELYHCGASIKDLGKKCFAINKIEDEAIIKQLINQ